MRWTRSRAWASRAGPSAGTSAALAVLKRPDVFKAAVAGAPVVDWRDYDTHYTERYLGLPETTPPRPTRRARCSPTRSRLERPLLIMHGTADDNVYFFHPLKLSDALFRAGKPHELLPLCGLHAHGAGSAGHGAPLRARADPVPRACRRGGGQSARARHDRGPGLGSEPGPGRRETARDARRFTRRGRSAPAGPWARGSPRTAPSGPRRGCGSRPPGWRCGGRTRPRRRRPG